MSTDRDAIVNDVPKDGGLRMCGRTFHEHHLEHYWTRDDGWTFWCNGVHEFRENVNDASMCVCGIPAITHAETEGS